MAVVAHSVGEDTIGTEKRGMLIKDNDGDFGLVTGVWTWVEEGKKGIPGTRNRRGVPGKPRTHGFCSIMYTNLRDKNKTLVLEYHPSLEILNIKGLQVNLKSGKITILKNEPHVLQNICLAFSVCTLYLLVQPRPEDTGMIEEQFGRAMAKVQKERSRGKNFPIPQIPPFLQNKDKPILEYCGWKHKEQIPSNSTISIYRKQNRRFPYYPGVFWGYGYYDGAHDSGSGGDGGGGGDEIGGGDFAGCGGCGGG